MAKNSMIEGYRNLVSLFMHDQPNEGPTSEIWPMVLRFEANDPKVPEWVKVHYEKIGRDFFKKFNQENVQYQAMAAGLKAKRAEMEYYFPDQKTSRKIVATSTDCISLVQAYKDSLMVYMRSSDIVGLLPCDLVGLKRMAVDVVGLGAQVHVMIAIPHIYNKDWPLLEAVYKNLEAHIGS